MANGYRSTQAVLEPGHPERGQRSVDPADSGRRAQQHLDAARPPVDARHRVGLGQLGCRPERVELRVPGSVLSEIDREANVAGLTSSQGFSVFVSNNGTNGVVGGTIGAADTTTLGINGLTIANATSAATAVSTIASAVSSLGSTQATVGTLENRLQYAISLAQSQVTNTASAESQIRDANIATESANLTKYSILTQSGVAALAQANSTSSRGSQAAPVVIRHRPDGPQGPVRPGTRSLGRRGVSVDGDDTTAVSARRSRGSEEPSRVIAHHVQRIQQHRLREHRQHADAAGQRAADRSADASSRSCNPRSRLRHARHATSRRSNRPRARSTIRPTSRPSPPRRPTRRLCRVDGHGRDERRATTTSSVNELARAQLTVVVVGRAGRDDDRRRERRHAHDRRGRRRPSRGDADAAGARHDHQQHGRHRRQRQRAADRRRTASAWRSRAT